MYQKELSKIGKRIEELRKDKGWTQETLAEKIGISRNTLTKLEGGFRDFKSGEFIKISKALDNVSVDYLLGLSKNPYGDADDKAIEKRLGLTAAAISTLEMYQKEVVPTPYDSKEFIDLRAKVLKESGKIVDTVIGSENFSWLIQAIRSYAIKKPKLTDENAYSEYISKVKALPEYYDLLPKSPSDELILHKYNYQKRAETLIESVVDKVISESEE